MKRLKKIMSLLLTAIMVIAMCVPVMAEGETRYTITAPSNGHQYEIYQIFTGKLKVENEQKILSDVKWGGNGTGNEGTAVSDDVIAALTAVNSKTDKEKLEVIKTYATLSNPVAIISNSEGFSAAAGYYLIKDKDSTVTGTDVYTTYIVEVVGDVSITPKADVPSFEKKIKDTNDTTGEVSDWQDSADYDIGDQVPFKLEGIVADNYSDYEKYYFAFHDKEEDGLTFNPNSVKVYLNDINKPINSANYELKTAGITDGCTFEIVFSDLKKVEGVSAGTKIRVEYTSELNSRAVLGKPGNVNGAKLEFSNNPNEEQVGTPSTGETPWDNVIVFTYKVVVNKVKNSVDGDPLEGAEFTLVKKLSGRSTKEIGVSKTNGSTFKFSGLDDGEYILTETTTPEGYNTIDPITFTVTAEHTITWNGEDRNTILTSLTGSTADGKIEFTSDDTKSELSTKVVNKSGSTLPTTGGIGTTIFYVVGVVLMLGAGVLLITKRRMSAKH